MSLVQYTMAEQRRKQVGSDQLRMEQNNQIVCLASKRGQKADYCLYVSVWTDVFAKTIPES